MNIVIAGGRNEADFLIKLLLKDRHKLTIINNDNEYSQYLSNVHNIPVLIGDPSKEYVLNDAEINGSDVIISLCSNDSDNYVVCEMAKKVFNIKKRVCIVSNPKNVDVFKKLGIDTVISATYLVAKFIEQASTIENLIKSLSIEDEKIILTEIEVSEDYVIVGKKIMELNLPENTNISCIIRNTDIVIPNGQTIIQKSDHLLIVSTPYNQKNMLNSIQKKKNEFQK